MLKSNSLILCSARRGRFLISLIAVCLFSFAIVYQLGSLLFLSSEPDYFSNLQPNSYAAFQIDTFNTSMAELSIIDIIASDYKNRLSIFRRIVNLDRDEIFVSEVELVIPENVTEISDTRLLPIDYNKINYAARPLVSPAFASGSLSYNPETHLQILIIGLGGSQINNFLHNAFPMANISNIYLLMDITVIELEQEMVKIARKYFGLQQDATQRVLVMDGKKYLQEAAEMNHKFDAIYIDACPTIFPQEEKIMCPISPFLNPKSITNMRIALKASGTLVVKMLLFAENVDFTAEKIADAYRKEFSHCTVMPMISTYNRVLVCGGSNVSEYQVSNTTLATGYQKFVKHFDLETIDYGEQQ